MIGRKSYSMRRNKRWPPLSYKQRSFIASDSLNELLKDPLSEYVIKISNVRAGLTSLINKRNRNKPAAQSVRKSDCFTAPNEYTNNNTAITTKKSVKQTEMNRIWLALKDFMATPKLSLMRYQHDTQGKPEILLNKSMGKEEAVKEIRINEKAEKAGKFAASHKADFLKRNIDIVRRTTASSKFVQTPGSRNTLITECDYTDYSNPDYMCGTKKILASSHKHRATTKEGFNSSSYHASRYSLYLHIDY